MTVRKVLGPCLAALVLLACATAPVVSKRYNTAGGESVLAWFKGGQPLPGENAQLRIEFAGFLINRQARELIYAFSFRQKSPFPLRAVRIEDVSGEQAQLRLLDETPFLSEKGFWNGVSAPLRAGNSDLAWIDEPGDTEKLFRFSFGLADGRELVLHQVLILPASSKPMLRGVFKP